MISRNYLKKLVDQNTAQEDQEKAEAAKVSMQDRNVQRQFLTVTRACVFSCTGQVAVATATAAAAVAATDLIPKRT